MPYTPISRWSPSLSPVSKTFTPASVLKDRMSTIDLSALTIAKPSPSSSASSSTCSSLSSSPFDSVLSQWQRLSLQSGASQLEATLTLRPEPLSRRNGGGEVYSDCDTFDPSAAHASVNNSCISDRYPRGSTEFELEHKRPVTFDTFLPRTSLRDGHPTSCSNGPILLSSMQKEALFFATRSRVVRLFHGAADMFTPHNGIPVPETVWEREQQQVFAVFSTHEEAATALSLSGHTMSVATAVHSDLEPYHSLRRFTGDLSLLPPQRSAMSETTTDYTLSTNPPNPKTSFRLGDWICASPKCAAHNFGRNLACIGCGCPRSAHDCNHHPSLSPGPSTSRALPSPRFNADITYYSSGPPPQQTSSFHHHHQQQQQPQNVQHPPIGSGYLSQPPSTSIPHVAHPPKTTHPLLTPSGRAFALGGKVQNVSTDPLNPCIMYWPDNEPLPEQGQIRPSGLVGIAQPPILNTGNRGPISHQPGDWICQKCNYLNWRRRKVCQTCLPYAEGNGDSISAAVQAERIALLTSVLSNTHLGGNGGLALPTQPQAPRSHSLTPPLANARRPFMDISPPHPHPQSNTLNKRSQSHYALGQQYMSSSQPVQSAMPHPGFLAPSPIYQTSGYANQQPQQHQRQPSPLYSIGPDMGRRLSPGSASQNGYFGNGSSGVRVGANSGTMPIGSHQQYSPQPQEYAHFAIQVQAPVPAPLLPSFLHDMVHSPALSPTSTTTSSADLSSVEECDVLASPLSLSHPINGGVPTIQRVRGDSGSSVASSSSLLGVDSPTVANIWRLDGEETKVLSGFTMPKRSELAPIGVGRKTSREGF